MSASARTPDATAATSEPSAAVGSARRSPLAWVVLGFVWLYRITSPLRSPRCRFHPSCSSYALEAVKVHGAARGGWFAIRRLGRCHPWNPGGVDHVPPRK